MKKLYTLTTFLFLFIFCFKAHAQNIFWTEDFGTTCRFRGHANNYASPNGVWTVTSTGANAAYANEWYINNRIQFNGLGNCAVGSDLACGTNINNSLHIGGVANSFIGVPEDSASYWTGYYCSSMNFCSTTNKRVESPVINCTGKSAITLSFFYYEGGDTRPGGKNGDATLWYYDGTSWSLIDSLAKTANNKCSGTTYGVFTSHSITLPPSADNNPNIKLGFQWSNDDLSGGTDPSFALDNIVLSVLGPSGCASSFVVAKDSSQMLRYTATSTSSGIAPLSYYWTWGDGSHDTAAAPAHTYANQGYYNICLTIIDSTGCISISCDSAYHVYTSVPPVTQFNAYDTSMCAGSCMNFVDLSAGFPTAWKWSFPGGNPSSSTLRYPYTCYSTPGYYSITLITYNANGSDTLTKTNFIDVHVPPVASFAIVPDTSQLLHYNVVNSSTGAPPLQYHWSWGDGTHDYTANPSHTYAGPGLYNICLTVTDDSSGGMCSNTYCIIRLMLHFRRNPLSGRRILIPFAIFEAMLIITSGKTELGKLQRQELMPQMQTSGI